MPLYEYQCPSCAISFEELVRSQSEQVRCPRCGGTEVSRMLSTFAMHGGGGDSFSSSSGSTSGSGGCSGCSGGHCGSCH